LAKDIPAFRRPRRWRRRHRCRIQDVAQLLVGRQHLEELAWSSMAPNKIVSFFLRMLSSEVEDWLASETELLGLQSRRRRN
jgi:hypothetical protein